MSSAIARLAVYAGSFDPPTLGHLDLIERASALFSDVIVGIGRHPREAPLFRSKSDWTLVARVSAHLPNVTVESFEGLLVEFCKVKQARVIVRGLRAATDFEYELQIAHANADLEPEHRHGVSPDAHEERLHQRIARAGNREPWGRREPLRAAPRLRSPLGQVPPNLIQMGP